MQYKEKTATYAAASISDEHKAEIFNHIYQFFSRYYDNGDFMSMRRYSARQKFAVPYNGEEVLLHWANKDQYYIKTGEYFFNYTFHIGEFTVRFQVIQAETTINNTKTENRFFILNNGEKNISYDEKLKELVILFEYRALTDSEKTTLGSRNVQDILNEQAKDSILSNVPDAGLKAGLTRENEGKIPLVKHISTYAKRNTTDYFIHKDLYGFLTQELDFYIKNEMFDLDDLGTKKEIPVEQYLNRVRVMKVISLKIIAFISQIEDFQKKLFEKKKFVISANYCMTLDRVPESLYAEVVKNTDQITEWTSLYSFGEPGGQITLSGKGSNVIDVEFLKAHPYLVLDTKFFPQEFKDKLLSTFDDLDDATNGLMVRSENWQALNLLQVRYQEQVKCIYIDPPYNTGSDEFLYKDNYQHSSWLAMMGDRIEISIDYLSKKGVFFQSCDNNEVSNSINLLNLTFGEQNLVEILIWKRRATAPNDRIIGKNHEYILSYSKDVTKVELFLQPRSERTTLAYTNPDNDSRGPWRASDISGNGKGGRLVESCVYPIINPITKKSYYPPKNKCWLYNQDKVASLIKDYRIGFRESTGTPYLKRFLSEVRQGETLPTIIDNGGFSSDSALQISELFGNPVVEFPKPLELMTKVITAGSSINELTLDFFAGSGTTAHAIINMNRNDKGNRKYILVEMGDYFHTVLKPRIEKAIYSSEWKDGKPQNTDGISHIFKYLTLEQYEDTLNNIEFKEGSTVQKTLMDMDGYILRYMLDFESRESPCRMNTTKLERPFEYTLRITKDSELHNETVDLVETFNYLLGLKVKRIRTYLENGTIYRVVHGETLTGLATTVIWRTSAGLDLKQEKVFIEEKILTDPKLKAERVFINGDFHVEGALPIEPEFQRLMGA